VTHEALATAQLDLRLGQVGRYRLLFSPRAQVRWEGRLGARLESSLERRLTVGVELN
jgi:hypothetical protein